METNYRTIAKNSAYFVGGKALGALASFAAATALGFFVPRGLAGTYSYVMAVLSIVNIATLPGMGDALARAVARGHDGSFFSIIRKRVRFGLFGSAASLLASAWFFHVGDSGLGAAFLVAAPFIPLTDTFSDVAVYYWQGKRRFDRSALTYGLYYAGVAALSIPLFVFARTSVMLVGGVLAAQTLSGYAVYRSVRRHVAGTQDAESERLGMHLTAMKGIRLVTNNLGTIIVFTLFGPAATAVYAFASTPVNKLWQLLPIGPLALPALSTLSLTHETKRRVLAHTALLFLLTIPAAVLLVVLAPFLYHIFFPHYTDSIALFRVIAATIAFSPFLYLKAALTAFHRTKALYINELISPAATIALMAVLGLRLGLPGIAYGLLGGNAVEFLVLAFCFAASQPHFAH